MDTSTIVLIFTIVAIAGGALIVIRGSFWLVDEFHKDKPFGFDFSPPPPKPKTMASAVQRRPKPPSAPKPPTPAAPPNAFEEAMKPKPSLGEATQRKPRKRVNMPKGNIGGIPPGAKKLDV